MRVERPTIAGFPSSGIFDSVQPAPFSVSLSCQHLCILHARDRRAASESRAMTDRDGQSASLKTLSVAVAAAIAVGRVSKCSRPAAQRK